MDTQDNIPEVAVQKLLTLVTLLNDPEYISKGLCAVSPELIPAAIKAIDEALPDAPAELARRLPEQCKAVGLYGTLQSIRKHLSSKRLWLLSGLPKNILERLRERFRQAEKLCAEAAAFNEGQEVIRTMEKRLARESKIRRR